MNHRTGCTTSPRTAAIATMISATTMSASMLGSNTPTCVCKDAAAPLKPRRDTNFTLTGGQTDLNPVGGFDTPRKRRDYIDDDYAPAAVDRESGEWARGNRRGSGLTVRSVWSRPSLGQVRSRARWVRRQRSTARYVEATLGPVGPANQISLPAGPDAASLVRNGRCHAPTRAGRQR